MSASYRNHLIAFAVVLVGGSDAYAQLQNPDLQWTVSSPFLSVKSAQLPASKQNWVALKDPSIVRYHDQWHLFCTLRKDSDGDGRIRIGYSRFNDWDSAPHAEWNVLDLTMGYHGAPQIFWFQPHQLWYLIYQAEDSSRNLKYGPCYSTNPDLSCPEKWTKPEPLYVVPDGKKAGLDFWVICDDRNAHLFFTTLNGRLWRAETSLTDFPDKGWSEPAVTLKADIFEASHTYRLQGVVPQFLTIVEAKTSRRRHFKGFVADQLEGPWKAIAKGPWISADNVRNQDDSWADSYSHGEFIRSGFDQTLTIDPKSTKLLFQGVSDKEYRRSYGQIPWKLGVLTRVHTADRTQEK